MPLGPPRGSADSAGPDESRSCAHAAARGGSASTATRAVRGACLEHRRLQYRRADCRRGDHGRQRPPPLVRRFGIALAGAGDCARQTQGDARYKRAGFADCGGLDVSLPGWDAHGDRRGRQHTCRTGTR